MEQEKTTTRHLAQVLHDQLGQTLTAIRLGFDTLPAAEPASPAAARQQRLHTLIDDAIHQVRQVLTELRPPLLEEQGLAAALDNEIRSRETARPEELEILLSLDELPEGQRWPAEVEYAVFMVAREAIANAIRHAGASVLRVALGGAPGQLRLDVEDNGCGLPERWKTGRPGHLGVVGMRERAEAIGAQFGMETVNGEGTTVWLSWAAR
ncbi:histidine kinase [Aquabacterium sp. A7-Y]|nr:histidine kinase [Aquabacterium sp. A7-Y]